MALCTFLLNYLHIPFVHWVFVLFEEVLLISGDAVKIGQPTVAGAKVTAKVLAQGKEKKIRIFKYKAKSNYRRRQGHRQPFTKVQIEKIEG